MQRLLDARLTLLRPAGLVTHTRVGSGRCDRDTRRLTGKKTRPGALPWRGVAGVMGHKGPLNQDLPAGLGHKREVCTKANIHTILACTS